MTSWLKWLWLDLVIACISGLEMNGWKSSSSYEGTAVQFQRTKVSETLQFR